MKISLDSEASDGRLRELRLSVRDFLQSALDEGRFQAQVDAWIANWDPAFSLELAGRGWIGMTIPREYGGHGRSYLERYVVLEELLAYGAPVAAHWVGDRQAAPALLRYGTERQKKRLLPQITAGTISFAIGMSEPESGSDLASVSTRARPVEGGWSISGRKIWTSGAHHADLFFVLARTSSFNAKNRHEGLSQFLVNLNAPGVTIDPILSMNGEHHFNEVLLDDVMVPEERVVGRIGDGWKQVTSELAYERSGPERFLSSFSLLMRSIDSCELQTNVGYGGFGRHLASVVGLHQLSVSIARTLEAGEDAELPAALVKVLGTREEGDLIASIDRIVHSPSDNSLGSSDVLSLEAEVNDALLRRPGFTLRGGSTEVLMGVIARRLGMR